MTCLKNPLDILVPPTSAHPFLCRKKLAASVSINSRLLRQRGANRGAHTDGVSSRLMCFPLPGGHRFKFTEVKDMNLPQELHGSAALRGMQGR